MLTKNKQNRLQTFTTEDGIEVVIDMSTGETWTTVKGYSRMSGKLKSTIFRKKGDKLKEAEISTKEGTENVVLIPESTILEWLEEDKPSLLTEIAQLGIRTTLHKWAGVDFSEQKQKPKKQLPPERDAVDLINAGQTLEKISNPMLRSILEQRLMEDAQNSNSSDSEPKECIVTVRAKELGFSDQQIGSGKGLGMYVKNRITPIGKQQHGRYPVNTFHKTEELDQVIHSYFN